MNGLVGQDKRGRTRTIRPVQAPSLLAILICNVSVWSDGPGTGLWATSRNPLINSATLCCWNVLKTSSKAVTDDHLTVPDVRQALTEATSRKPHEVLVVSKVEVSGDITQFNIVHLHSARDDDNVQDINIPHDTCVNFTVAPLHCLDTMVGGVAQVACLGLTDKLACINALAQVEGSRSKSFLGGERVTHGDDSVSSRSTHRASSVIWNSRHRCIP